MYEKRDSQRKRIIADIFYKSRKKFLKKIKKVVYITKKYIIIINVFNFLKRRIIMKISNIIDFILCSACIIGLMWLFIFVMAQLPRKLHVQNCCEIEDICVKYGMSCHLLSECNDVYHNDCTNVD